MMSVELTPIPDNGEMGDAKYIILIDYQGKKRKADLQITIEEDGSTCRYYAFTGFHFIGGAPVFSAGKTDTNQPDQLFPLDAEELDMVTETIQVGISQVRKELREEHPILSKCLPWFFNPSFSPSRTESSVTVESIDRQYSYSLK